MNAPLAANETQGQRQDRRLGATFEHVPACGGVNDTYILERLVDENEVVVFSHHPRLGRLYWMATGSANDGEHGQFGLTAEIARAVRFPREWNTNVDLHRRHHAFTDAIARTADQPDGDAVDFGWHGVDQLASQARWSRKEFQHWMQRAVWEEIAAPLKSSYLSELPAAADLPGTWTETIGSAMAFSRHEMERVQTVLPRLVGSAFSRFVIRPPSAAEMAEQNSVVGINSARIGIPEILVPLITRHAGDNAKHMTGTTDSRQSLGHIKLTYAAKRVFGVHRFPTHPERFVTDWHRNEDLEDIIEALESTPEKEWKDLCRALQSYHLKTVAALRKRFPSGKVVLQRRLELVAKGPANHFLSALGRRDDMATYTGQICVAAMKARREHIHEIFFETDVLTGWCLDDPIGYGDVLLRKEFDINDVVMAAPFAYPAGKLETDEWIVLNRHPAGLMGIDVADIDIPPELEADLAEKAADLGWDALLQMRWSNTTKRVRAFLLPPNGDCRHEPPWFVNLAFRLDRYLAARRARKAMPR